jgi:hypothetical protein
LSAVFLWLARTWSAAPVRTVERFSLLSRYRDNNDYAEQLSVSDSKKTVKTLLDEAGVTVTRFVRLEIGEQ